MSTNKAEQAVAYAALILADDSIAITPEKLQALLKAAGIEDVEPIWTTLFANALKDKNVKDILTAVTTTEVGRGIPNDSKKDEKNGGAAGEDGEDENDREDVVAESDDDETFGDLFA